MRNGLAIYHYDKACVKKTQSIYYVIPSEVPFFGTKSRNLPAWSTNPGISKRVRW